MTDDREPLDHPSWPVRIWLLMALGAALGLAFHLLVRADAGWTGTEDPLRVAGAALVAVGGIVFAFSLERLRWAWSAAFALAAGLVAGGVALWNGSPSGWGSDEGWQFASCLAAVAIAVPLFQAIRDEGRRRVAVRAVQAYAWANAILWAAAAGFVLATFLLTLLLSELFKLIGIRILADLLSKGWFAWMLGCGALGAAVGILRDRDKVLGALQKVVRAVLSFLAPVLALGLVLFVLALPFTGLGPLWEQTKATTPILLACVAGAVILANAVIGNSREEEPGARPLRWAAAALAVVLLPLGAVAAVSTAKRIAQYGYTPERLWAAVFVAVALAAAATYLFALLRGRERWPDSIRRANVRLAAGISLLALFLALPILSFGAISTRDQVARLSSGRVSPDKFDWAALRFDFGPSGRRALERLAASPVGPTRKSARAALAATDRWEIERQRVAATRKPPRLQVDGGAPVPASLLDQIARSGRCEGDGCRVVFLSSGEALVLAQGCDGCLPALSVYRKLANGDWGIPVQVATPPAGAGAPSVPLGARRVEVRPVSHREIFIDGRPTGEQID